MPQTINISDYYRPNRQQKKAHETRAFETLYGGAAGGGKLAPLDSTVWTPFGPKRMGDIQVGDQVCNPDGGVARVIAVWPQGEKDIYRVTFDDGASCEVGLDHLWLCRQARVRRFRKKAITPDLERWGVATTAQVMMWVNQRKSILIPLTRPVSFTLTARRAASRWPIPPYSLGALLGDGCFHGKALTLTTPDQDIVERMRAEGFGPTSSYLGGRRCPSYSFLAGARNAVIKLGLWDTHAWDKFVPEAYKLTPIPIRQALLQGLMDTDGYADKRGHASFSTTSARLASDVQWLARSLGYKANLTTKTPTYRYKGEKRKGRLAYSVWVKGTSHEGLFSVPRKRERAEQPFNNGTGERARRIVSVEFSRKAEAQCISVDHPNGLYLTDDFIVTHNSWFLLWEALLHCLEGGPKARAVLFRRTFEEIRDSLVDESLVVYPPELGTYNKQERGWTFANGSTLIFRGLEHRKDVERYRSAQFSFIGLDEVTTFLEYMYVYLMSRCRTRDVSIRPRIVAATNPGGIGHAWVKARFPIAQPEHIQHVYAKGSNNTDLMTTRVFIPARLTDNTALMTADPGYLLRLRQLPLNQRRALIDGDWEIFQGQAFAEWSGDLHVVEPFDIPEDWIIVRSLDWGYSTPFYVAWLAVKPTSPEQIFLVDEWYGAIKAEAGVKGLEMDAPEVARKIVEREHVYPQGVAYGIGPPDMKRRQGDSRMSVWQHFVAAGLNLRTAERDRKAGKLLLHALLRADPNTLKPRFSVFERCRDFIRTLPELTLDERDNEDVDTRNPEDHPYDAVRYGLMSRGMAAMRSTRMSREEKAAVEESHKIGTFV